MGSKSNGQKKLITVVLISIIHMTVSKPPKFNPSPVHENADELMKPEEKARSLSHSLSLPYSNPLVGKNARIHAQNQQAMYNAERLRQHKAQLQRWTKAPQQIDSYMKAFQESQENHHLALEREQTKFRDNAPSRITTTSPLQPATKSLARDLKKESFATIKITEDDAMIKAPRNRNHRSHGSVGLQHTIQPKKYRSVFLAPGPTFDEGVTIKPNGVTGLSHYNEQSNLLYTEATPSSVQHFYPAYSNPAQNYQPTKDIDTLNSLLIKPPTDQLSGLNALIHSDDVDQQLNTPVELYFYVKDHPKEGLSQYHNEAEHVQISQNFGNALIPEHTHSAEDHKPITEIVDDIEDPNKGKPLKLPRPQPQSHLAAPLELETTTVKTNNYYKVEVASQIITSGYKPPNVKQNIQDTETPNYYLQQNIKGNGDLSERYLHHNAHHKGIHYLSNNGTGVSAYGDENLQYAANYEFGYRVLDQHSGNDFGHHEETEAGKTSGQYHVLLPDGRLQSVKYSAGPEGFHADITYDHLKNPY